MSGTLFICGDARYAQGVARDEGHGYWSTALPLVLEKHGLLAVRTAGPEQLEDAALLRSADAVLIAGLPDGAWTPSALRAISDSGAPVLVEGPLDPALASLLGIEAVPADREGSVAVRDADLRERGMRYGADPGGAVRCASTRPVDRDGEWGWQAIDEVPLTVEHAQTWQAPSWKASQWQEVGQGEVLASWTPATGGAAHPAIVRHGDIHAVSFGLFSYLAQTHTAEPVAGAEHRTSPRALGLEVLLLGLLEQMHARAGRPLARVLPWPAGYRWALSVRHDFDRRLPARQVREVLRRHDAAGSAATWYWRAQHLDRGGRSLLPRSDDRRAVRDVVGHPRQEVALHTEGVWRSGAAERGLVERATGQAVRGTSAHGAPDGFRWQGAPNVLWAHQQQLAYTEMIQHSHLHPHRFAALGAEGSVEPLDLICLPHHESLDRSSRGGDTADEQVLAAAAAHVRAGGLLQVLNHPDINLDALFALLARLPDEGRWDVTAGEAADWWARTHVSGRLRLTWASDTQLRVESDAGVAGLSVEIRAPDGGNAVHVVELRRGESAALG